MTNRAQIQYNLLIKTRNAQGMIGKQPRNEPPIEPWTSRHEAQLRACQIILNEPEKVHAVCEVRERKRNSTLGLLPTVSELHEIITTEAQNPGTLHASDKTAELYEFFEPEINLSR
jgi:hypothetical protein